MKTHKTFCNITGTQGPSENLSCASTMLGTVQDVGGARLLLGPDRDLCRARGCFSAGHGKPWRTPAQCDGVCSAAQVGYPKTVLQRGSGAGEPPDPSEMRGAWGRLAEALERHQAHLLGPTLCYALASQDPPLGIGILKTQIGPSSFPKQPVNKKCAHFVQAGITFL